MTAPRPAATPGASRRFDILILIIALAAAVAVRFDLPIPGGVRRGVLGLVMLAAAMYVVGMWLTAPRRIFGVGPVLTAWGLLILTLVIATINSFDLGVAIRIILQFTLVMLWCVFVSTLPMNRNRVRLMTIFAVTVIVANLLAWIAQGGRGININGLMENRFAYAEMLCFLMFFPWFAALTTQKRLYKYLTLLLILVTIFSFHMVSGRAPLLVFMICVTFYFSWRLVTAHITIFFSSLIVMLVGIAVFVWFFARFYDYAFMQALDAWVVENMGRTMASGRQEVWQLILDSWSKSPWIGQGVGLGERRFVFYEPHGDWLSAHNLYVSMIYQTGVMGLTALFGLIMTIWWTFWRARRDPVVRLAASFFVGMLAAQNFAVSLIYNSGSMALLFWTIIGIGLRRAFLVIATENQPTRPARAVAASSGVSSVRQRMA